MGASDGKAVFVGAALWVALGVALWVALDDALGVALGDALGVALGAAIPLTQIDNTNITTNIMVMTLYLLRFIIYQLLEHFSPRLRANSHYYKRKNAHEWL
ncbi:MAG: hypothetical protein RR956_08535 [Christensenella sp.]